MVSSMKLLLMILLLIVSFVFATYELDDALMEKDLYKILGLTKHASMKDIKRSFRKLAQKHHPDKAKPENIKHNEWVFRGIAEAYEVLSSKTHKAEYDLRRKHREQDAIRAKTAKATTQKSNSDKATKFSDIVNAFEDGADDITDSFGTFADNFLVSDNSQNPDYFQPSVTGPRLNAKQVRIMLLMQPIVVHFKSSTITTLQILFPYDPILATADRSTFALLDETCSIVVLKGDLDAFVRNVLIHGYGMGVNGTESSDFDELYRTPSFPYLQGFCFAGLGETGVLQIFKGHPVGYNYYSVWTSARGDGENNNKQHDAYDSYELQLSTEGTLTVYRFNRHRHHFHAHARQCIWSSASATCNEFTASVRTNIKFIGLELKRFFSLPNLRSLGQRILASKAMTRMVASARHVSRIVLHTVTVWQCRVQYLLDKYVIQVQDLPGAGADPDSQLADCIREAEQHNNTSDKPRRKER